MALWKWPWVTVTQFFGNFPTSSSLSSLLPNLEFSSFPSLTIKTISHLERANTNQEIEVRYFMHHSDPRNGSYIFDLIHKFLTIHRLLLHQHITQSYTLYSFFNLSKNNSFKSVVTWTRLCFFVLGEGRRLL